MTSLPTGLRHDALCDRYDSLKARCAELKETISDKQTPAGCH